MRLSQKKMLRSYLDQYHKRLTYAVKARGNAEKRSATIASMLNGEVTRGVNNILGRDQRRSSGIFFSGETWAERVKAVLPKREYRRYVDPACGVGDLLLAVAAQLPLQASLKGTLESWECSLRGIDIHEAFPALAWSRIQALAIHRHGLAVSTGNLDIKVGATSDSFSHADALRSPWLLDERDCIVMNPPFQQVDTPQWSTITSGKVTAAALFLEKAICTSPPGVDVVAIVPEVLRSGSRFIKLRRLLQETCLIHLFESAGRFSAEADIDVAVLAVTVGRSHPTYTAGQQPEPTPALGDRCKVHVGSVVPHRLTHQAKKTRYLDVPGAPQWQEVEVERFTDYVGRTFDPPFVVVRRTSSPGDKKRARATIVRGAGPVLVENHLLVLLPARRTLTECRRLVAILRDDRTDAWLNEELRCRHLTVGVVARIPDWSAVA